MNNLPSPKTELIGAALARFQAQTGLQAMRATKKNGPNPDARIQITDGLQQWFFDVACQKRIDRVAMLHGVEAHIQGFKHTGMLIVPYLAPELARSLPAEPCQVAKKESIVMN